MIRKFFSSTAEIPEVGPVPRHIAEMDKVLAEKEKDLMAV